MVDELEADELEAKIDINIPKITNEQLEWLEKQGYGSKQEIIRDSGIIKHILDMYSSARKLEEKI